MPFRTRIGDLSYYTGNKTRVAEIPTKEFANKIAVNLTDVRILCILAFAVFDVAIKDHTHQPEYYNPEFDVQTDHGTVRVLRHPDHVTSAQ